MYESETTILRIGDVINVTFDGFDVPVIVNGLRGSNCSRIQINVSCVFSAETNNRWIPIERALYPLLDAEGCLIGFNTRNPAIKT